MWDTCTSHFGPKKFDQVGRGGQGRSKYCQIWASFLASEPSRGPFMDPGCMIANSIPAWLVATRMRVALPRARACHCHAHAHGHTMRACVRTYHAHAQGYAMHRDLASKIVQPVKIENQIQNRCPSGNADYLHFISSRKNTLCLII